MLNLVQPESRVLDLGCGDGALLNNLIRKKSVKGFGVEISREGIAACIARGLPVYQGDIDQGLSDHGDQSFDYVILSHTLQAIHRPRFVLEEMLRVGRKIIVSFPNFGHWRVRALLGFGGRMPRSKLLPYAWHDTPNIHLCTVLDFQDLCRDMEIQILDQHFVAESGNRTTGVAGDYFVNLLSALAIFLLEHKTP